MSVLFIGYLTAAALVTIAPGLDTALVLRTAAVSGSKSAFCAGLGISLGCLVWAGAVALGVGAVLNASELAYSVLKWVGATYLLWVGVRLISRPRIYFDVSPSTTSHPFLTGFLTNVLNPKVGVFYVSFLPQFVPEDVTVGPYIMFLGFIHAAIGTLWFLTLIALTRPIVGFIKRRTVLQVIDRITGGVFISFSAALAFESTR